MIGRAAYSNPFLFAAVDSAIYGRTDPGPSRGDIVQQMVRPVHVVILAEEANNSLIYKVAYTEEQVADGEKMWGIARHMLGLFANMPGGIVVLDSFFRRTTSAHSRVPSNRSEELEEVFDREG